MKRLQLTLGAVAIFGVALLAACSKTDPEPEKVTGSSPVGRETVPSRPSASASAGPDDLAWDTPKGWQSVPNTNTMRKATYRIPKIAGDADDAELTVSAASGGVDANIKRWSGQFGNAEAKVETRTPNGLKVTVVEIKGTFASGGMMGGPTTSKPQHMLLGAVVDGGERQHFFKMTGPEKTVIAAKQDFDAFVASFRAK